LEKGGKERACRDRSFWGKEQDSWIVYFLLVLKKKEVVGRYSFIVPEGGTSSNRVSRRRRRGTFLYLETENNVTGFSTISYEETARKEKRG